ncbi:MAG: carbohydrate ABC transporter permease [Candidatus Nanopelagicaceae bacterium]|jgi:N,N'-diacetylchitobiose transport system permease protein
MSLKTSTPKINRRFWPYLLIAPASFVILLILGFPVYRLFTLSLQQFGLDEIISGIPVWVGLDNFTILIRDPEFWVVLRRTLIFTFGMVFFSVVIGAFLAHLMVRMHPIIRWLLNTTLILVWAIPALVGVSIWKWMFSYEFSIITTTLNRLGFDFAQRNWFTNPISGFTIIGAIVVWGAVPFIAISIYAALTQVPKDLIEAAAIDGANSHQIFRSIIFPILLPIYVILISLSIIWDFQVFTQIWVVLDSRPPSEYYTMAIYAFEKSFGLSEYGMGAAIALLMIVALLGVTWFYIRKMIEIGETRER